MTESTAAIQQLSALLRGVVVCGRFVPGVTWSETGHGWLWLETGEMSIDATSHLLNELTIALDVQPVNTSLAPTIQGTPAIAMEEQDFVRAIRLLTHSPQWHVTPELDLYSRILRAALDMVTQRDIVAFAAPPHFSATDIHAMGLRLANQDEDGLMEWGSYSQTYVAAWLPKWNDPRLRALRLIYISVAETVWKDGWNKVLPWKKRDHGQMLVDSWIWLCVDLLTRQSLMALPPATDSPPSSPYRIPYRGEQELGIRWRTALWSSRHKAEFSADGWLLQRILRQQFVQSGWRAEWLSNRTGNAYYHLEFELIPPRKDSVAQDWYLSILVVHNEWPENQRPLSDWWRTSSRVWTIGNDTLYESDLWILPTLRAAGEFAEPLAKSLQHPAPSGFAIAPEELFSFVTDYLPALQEHGFPIRLPALETVPMSDVRIRVRVKRAKSASVTARHGRQLHGGWFGAGQLIDFDWNLVIGDTEISQDEFFQMVANHTPYLELNGSWKLIPAKSILHQLEQLQSGKSATTTTFNLLSRILLTLDATEDPLMPVDVSYDDEAFDIQQAIRALKTAATPPFVPSPGTFQGELRHYQQTGYSWLLHLRHIHCGACLADDMGLGKTIQVLAYLLHLKEQQQAQGPHLLICPTSLLQNWKAEIARFSPSLRTYIHHGSARNADSAGVHPLDLPTQQADVILTTYATLTRDLDFLKERQWDAIIVDEAQNIKNASTKQAHAVRALKGHHRIALTGTPVENRLEELWSILHFTNPGYLGSAQWFRKTFADPMSNHPSGPAARQLNALLRPILLRRRKADPAIQMELPDKWEIVEYAALTAEQAAIYQTIVNQLFTGLTLQPISRDSKEPSNMSRRGQILAALVRLKQVCDHPCLVLGGRTDIQRSGKLQLLSDMLEGVVEEGESALVFTQFRDMGELICDVLEQRFGRRPRFLHGGLSATTRGEIVTNFQNGTDTSPVLVLSLKAGGVGLNLTRANHVFHFDRWWNPAVEDQATDRAFRIGQTKDVQVHKLVCPGTLEERIDALISSKRQLSAAVGGTSESWLTELDDAVLQQLFELDAQTAVQEEVES